MIQTALAPFVRVGGVHPDLVLVLVIAWTILRSLEDGIIWALWGGLCLDFISAAPFGIFTAGLLLTVAATYGSQGFVFGTNLILPMSLIFPLSLLFNGFAAFILDVLGRSVIWEDIFATVLLPTALYNTVIMLIAFPLLYLLNRWLYPEALTF